jgi:uncharacterized damage-inducible protein DinB
VICRSRRTPGLGADGGHAQARIPEGTRPEGAELAGLGETGSAPRTHRTIERGPFEGVKAMFGRDGISELHGWTHESLDILLKHVSSVPAELLHTTLVGFGVPTVWKQLVHILEVEEGWVRDLQDEPFTRWRAEDLGSMAALLVGKQRVRHATQAYLGSLSELELNTRVAKRPKVWVGELKSPAFILLHVVTHTFHHKGQVVAMLRTLGYPAPDTDLQRE